MSLELQADQTHHDEALILVDEADRDVGFMSKDECHEGQGVLHRAFSVLIFNRDGDLLIQQRAAGKRLWPLYWSNSCCSHPRGRETLEVATHRRLAEELGISCPLKFLFKFKYQAQFDATGAEHELCSVFIGRHLGPLSINSGEIADWRWISPSELASEISDLGALKYTPWFMMEWARIWQEHRADVLSLTIT
jgi:isopentenyl-diphosphate delta-isomerase